MSLTVDYYCTLQPFTLPSRVPGIPQPTVFHDIRGSENGQVTIEVDPGRHETETFLVHRAIPISTIKPTAQNSSDAINTLPNSEFFVLHAPSGVPLDPLQGTIGPTSLSTIRIAPSVRRSYAGPVFELSLFDACIGTISTRRRSPDSIQRATDVTDQHGDQLLYAVLHQTGPPVSSQCRNAHPKPCQAYALRGDPNSRYPLALAYVHNCTSNDQDSSIMFFAKEVALLARFDGTSSLNDGGTVVWTRNHGAPDYGTY